MAALKPLLAIDRTQSNLEALYSLLSYEANLEITAEDLEFISVVGIESEELEKGSTVNAEITLRTVATSEIFKPEANPVKFLVTRIELSDLLEEEGLIELVDDLDYYEDDQYVLDKVNGELGTKLTLDQVNIGLDKSRVYAPDVKHINVTMKDGGDVRFVGGVQLKVTDSIDRRSEVKEILPNKELSGFKIDA